jgi:hypothetical protein
MFCHSERSEESIKHPIDSSSLRFPRNDKKTIGMTKGLRNDITASFFQNNQAYYTILPSRAQRRPMLCHSEHSEESVRHPIDSSSLRFPRNDKRVKGTILQEASRGMMRPGDTVCHPERSEDLRFVIQSAAKNLSRSLQIPRRCASLGMTRRLRNDITETYRGMMRPGDTVCHPEHSKDLCFVIQSAAKNLIPFPLSPIFPLFLH